MQYQIGKIVRFDKKTGRALFRISSPDMISNDEFNVWLVQSVNKACKQLYDETYLELLFANSINTMYLTQSSLKADLMSMDSKATDLMESQIANMAMKVEVLVFQNTDIDRIIDIRTNYGSSFAVFRSELGERLLQLSKIQDITQLEVNAP